MGFWSLLQIKAHLGGKRAKEINKESKKTEIVNQNNSVISVDTKIANFFKDTNIDNCTINIFTDLQKSDIENFTIKHGDKKMEFNKNGYDNMREKVVGEDYNISKLEQQKPFEVNLLLKNLIY